MASRVSTLTGAAHHVREVQLAGRAGPVGHRAGGPAGRDQVDAAEVVPGLEGEGGGISS